MPDPEVYCDYLTETFEDLKNATKRPAKKKTRKRASTKKAKR
jgi:hypothetical protein